MSKVPKTIEEQITLLKERKMSFRDESKARHYLANISYYRLKGYWWNMQEDAVKHEFRANSYFEDVIELYNFDKEFRLIVFTAIEQIEISLRTKLIYHLSLAHGATWHITPTHFTNNEEFDRFITLLNKNIADSKEIFITEHIGKHGRSVPPESWKSLELISLGALSRLYENLNDQLPSKNVIAKEFGLNQQKYLKSILRTITNVRNIVAHHGRLFNKKLPGGFKWGATSCPILDYTPIKTDTMFSVLSMIIHINNNINASHNIKSDLHELFSKYTIVNLKNMGFPENWEKQPIWK